MTNSDGSLPPADSAYEPARALEISSLLPVYPIPAHPALDEIALHWDKAEMLIKQAEAIRGEVVQPSINELRYAGRRLVDAWKFLQIDPELKENSENFERSVIDAKAYPFSSAAINIL